MLTDPDPELTAVTNPSLPTANARVVFCPVEEGAVLLSTEDEVYFGLNHVGARVWQLLPPKSESLEDLCAALAEEFPDAPPEEIRPDVLALLEELETHGLVTSVA